MLSNVIILLLFTSLSAVRGDIGNHRFTHYTNESANRRTKAQELRKYMNEEVLPCNNFYDFACGNWANVHPVNKTVQMQTTALHKTQSDVEQIILSLLSDDNAYTDTPIDRKVKDFYRSCVNLRTSETEYKEELKKIITDARLKPAFDMQRLSDSSFDWLKTIANISSKYNIQIIMGYSIDPDLDDRKVNRVTIGPPAFPLKKPSMYLEAANEIHLNNYRAGVMDHLMHYMDLDMDLAHSSANEIVDFEVALVGGLENSTSLEGEYTTVRKLQKKYSYDLDIRRYLEIALGSVPSERVMEKSPAYLENIIKVIKKTPMKVVANYIFYNLIKHFIMTPVPRDYNALQSSCITLTRTQFPDAVDHMVYRRTNVKEAEQAVINVFYDFKTILEGALAGDQYNWIDAGTRAVAVEKIKEMKLLIKSNEHHSFTEDYGKLIIDRWDLAGNLRSIFTQSAIRTRTSLYASTKPDYSEASLSFVPKYIQQENVIVVPAVFLQPFLFWSSSYPQAVNLAQLGFLMAHEMMHAIDLEGIKYDKKGNRKDWCDSKSLKAYEERAQCFQDQYKGFIFGGKLLPDLQALPETIVDNAGLRLVYKVYSLWHDSPLRLDFNGSSELLPDLGYTGKQLFFISFAQLWCTDRVPDYRGLPLPNDDSAPGDLKVTRTVSNMEEFSSAFQCQSDSGMSVQEKCVLF